MRLALLLFNMILLCPLLLNAQSNYKPGFVVTLEGDTLHGFINYKEWSNTPTSVAFREAANSVTEKEITPANTRYFEITGMEAYQRYDGKITMNPVAMDRISFETKALLEPAVVFLKRNYEGDQLDLLSYTDQIKTRFFFQEKDGSQPQELYYSRYYADSEKGEIATKTGYMGPRQYLVTQKGYIGQIQHLLNKYEVYTAKLGREVEYVQYDVRDLENLFIKINGMRDSRPASELQKRRNIRYFAGAALNSGTVRISGISDFDEPNSNPVSFMPQLSFGFDAFLNKHIQKLYLRLEGAVTAANYNVEKEIITEYRIRNTSYKISQQTFFLGPQLIYSLYNKENFKFNVGVAGRLNFATYSDNTYSIRQQDIFLNGPDRYIEASERDYMRMEPFWFTYGFRTGVIIKKNYEIYAVYNPYTAVSTKYFSSINISSFNVGVNYLFVK